MPQTQTQTVRQQPITKTVFLPKSIIATIDKTFTTNTQRLKAAALMDGLINRHIISGSLTDFVEVPHEYFTKHGGGSYFSILKPMLGTLIERNAEYTFDLNGKAAICTDGKISIIGKHATEKGTSYKYRVILPDIVLSDELIGIDIKRKIQQTDSTCEVSKIAADIFKGVSIHLPNGTQIKTNRNAKTLLINHIAKTITPSLIKENWRYIGGRNNDKIIGERDNLLHHEGAKFKLYRFKEGKRTPYKTKFNGKDNRNDDTVSYSKKTALKIAKSESRDIIEYKKHLILCDVNEFSDHKAKEIQFLTWHALDTIRQHGGNIERNKTNFRLDTPATNLNKLFDSMIRLRGRPLTQIDMKNSQFTLLSNLIQNVLTDDKPLIQVIDKYWDRRLEPSKRDSKTIGELLDAFIETVNSCKIEEDVYKFCSASFEGKLYDNFAAETKGLIERPEAKLINFFVVFSEVEDEEKKRKNKMIALFKSIYPSTYELLKDFKNRVGSEYLPIFLQAIESILFVDELFILLYRQLIETLTKHDSISLKDTDFKEGKRIIKAYLNQVLGVNRYELG